MNKNICSIKNVTATSEDSNFCIGERIKEQRKKMHLTQEQLAVQLSFSTVHIKKIENNERMPSLETLKTLKNILNVSYDYLIDGKKEKSNLELLIERFNALEKSEQIEFIKHAIDMMA